MADGNARPKANYSVKTKYTISEREKLILRYRELAGEIAKANGGHVSAQVLSDIIDDVFIGFDGWPHITDEAFKTLYHERLDQNTLRKFLVCDLGLSLRRRHDLSFQILDAFQQIVANKRPNYF